MASSPEVVWNDDNTVSIAPPKRPRKLTGTRFASVLGLNRWTTPFQTWCEITGAHREPFEDTVYTLAGKAIEPKQIAYMREAYFMDDLLDPTDVYGPDYFSKTYGNFFTDPVFGGMWDAIEKDGDTVESVLEFKTTKRAEDWVDGPPEYYALQAALYAWLLGCEQVVMVASFLEDGDYADPEAFVPSASNTATFPFMLHERYPSFEEDYVQPALRWWRRHVETGDSPEYDERADEDYLKALRNRSLNPTTDVDALLDELCSLQADLDAAAFANKAKSDRVSEIKAILKGYAKENMGDARTATIGNGRVECKLTRSASVGVDENALKRDGVFERYSKEKVTERFTVKFIKDKE